MSTEPAWLRQLSAKHYLNGVFTAAEGSDAHDVIDPATEGQIGQIVDASAAEIDRAVAVANEAQRRWNRTSMLQRAELLHEVAADIRSSRGALGESLTREMGKPFKESADEALWTASAVDYYAEVGRHEAGRGRAGQRQRRHRQTLGADFTHDVEVDGVIPPPATGFDTGRHGARARRCPARRTSRHPHGSLHWRHRDGPASG